MRWQDALPRRTRRDGRSVGSDPKLWRAFSPVRPKASPTAPLEGHSSKRAPLKYSRAHVVRTLHVQRGLRDGSQCDGAELQKSSELLPVAWIAARCARRSAACESPTQVRPVDVRRDRDARRGRARLRRRAGVRGERGGGLAADGSARADSGGEGDPIGGVPDLHGAGQRGRGGAADPVGAGADGVHGDGEVSASLPLLVAGGVPRRWMVPDSESSRVPVRSGLTQSQPTPAAGSRWPSAPREAQSRCRCGRDGPCPGADVGGVGPVPVQMWEG